MKHHNFGRILFGDTSSTLTGNSRSNNSNNNIRRPYRDPFDYDDGDNENNNNIEGDVTIRRSNTANSTKTEIELKGRKQQINRRKKNKNKKNQQRRRQSRKHFCRPNKDGLTGYFFGFMFEEDTDENDQDDDVPIVKNNCDEIRSKRRHLEVDGSGIFSPVEDSCDVGIDDAYDDSDDWEDDDDDYDDDESNRSGSTWNVLNMALFVAYGLTSATTTLPVLVVPNLGQELLPHTAMITGADYDANAGESGNVDISAFISRCASCAVLGVACGKLLNAPLPDVVGARRTSSICAALLSVPLLLLSLSSSVGAVTLACFLTEYIQSVQWPCVIVLLSVHYNRPNQRMQYQNGIYLTSIASKLGSLVAVPLFSSLLRQFHWRIVCLVGAWLAILSSSVMYLYVMDSPTETNQPQNALQPHLAQQLSTVNPFKGPRQAWVTIGIIAQSIFLNNLLPSLRHILTSWTFWVVALSHTGSSLISSSQRILGTYFYDTSLGYLPDAQSAGSLVIFLPLGTIFGLAIAGNIFAHRKGKNRKRLVTRLYILSIVSCYVLSILSIPRLRYAVDSPDLILFVQVVASLAMGFGIAVMSSVIPGLASAAFGNHRGFYTAYTDGVAYGISSMVWRIVATSVENGNSEGGGWAYGWAAVALLVVLSAVLLIECWSVLPALNGRSSGLSNSSTFRV
jgi:MFS family permease